MTKVKQLTSILLAITFSVNYGQNEKTESLNSLKYNSINSSSATNDKIEFRNEAGSSIITITDEGNDGGSISLNKITTSINTNAKLYNIDGNLYFNGLVVGSVLNSFMLLDNPVDGYVLTSDANGNASWESPQSNNVNLSIGDTHEGGIIFWLDGSGEHGLVAAPADENNTAQWRYYSLDGNPGGFARGIYAGESNTIIFNEFDPVHHNYAANVCFYKITNGYDDWYLPSIDETLMMMSNLYLEGLGNFTGSTYWTSNQPLSNNVLTTEAYAITLQDISGNPTVALVERPAGNSYNVRAIRKF